MKVWFTDDTNHKIALTDDGKVHLCDDCPCGPCPSGLASSYSITGSFGTRVVTNTYVFTQFLNCIDEGAPPFCRWGGVEITSPPAPIVQEIKLSRLPSDPSKWGIFRLNACGGVWLKNDAIDHPLGTYFNGSTTLTVS